MTIAVTEEQAALRDAVRDWAERTGQRAAARAAYDRDAAAAAETPGWQALAEMGVLGLHVPEERGGAGAGQVELAVALEELGRAIAPGPVLPTVLASLVLSHAQAEHAGKELLPGLADGTLRGAVALTTGDLRATVSGDNVTLRGTVGPVLGAVGADVVILGADGPEGPRWLAVDGTALDIRPLRGLDASRPLADVVADGVVVPADRMLNALDSDRVRQLGIACFAAEAAGMAGWCLDTATEYARSRVQFGRPIGGFQAVKHLCADMLVRVEQLRAVAWDAARAVEDTDQLPLTAAVAAAFAVDVGVDSAKDCIQVLGGIGFTWEHDAHFYLRRALTTRALLGGGDEWRQRAADRALAGQRRRIELALPAEAEPIRAEVREFLTTLEGVADPERRRRIVDAGYLQPHWPQPYGREAGAVEQLVIDEEFAAAGVVRPDLVIANWVLATLIGHASAAQRDRLVLPTMYGEYSWCQLFSEPGAGSDLASLQTRATRVEGGWSVTGQKVWTSLARQADWAILLARTSTEPDRHRGITYFVLDMTTPGIEIRPLREITGNALFNEVFLTDVFIPDECVVGEVGDGWRLARTTLSNERVGMSGRSSFGAVVEGVLADVADRPELRTDSSMRTRVGGFVTEGIAQALLGLRITMRQLSGADPGPGSSVRKLVGMHHQQDAAELRLELAGPRAAVEEAETVPLTQAFLSTRNLTIAGGTSQVLRNVIGERILGLPRDEHG